MLRKKKWVRKICSENHLDFIGIQETKSDEGNHKLVHSLWGDNNCKFAVKKSVGNSGGIMAVWNDTMFTRHNVIDGDGFLAIYGNWIKFGFDCLMIVVYAPNDLTKKQSLWLRLTNLVNNYNAPSIVLGDFNEVRFESERKGSIFCRKGSNLFNAFFSSAGLVDLPMGGRIFTRMNKFGTKLSKIYRIIVSHHFINMWPNAHVTVLPRDLSDHCPLILKTHVDDYGPIPFKFFNSWLLDGELSDVVSSSWSNSNGPITSMSYHILT